MNDRIDLLRSTHDGVVIPRIWITVALSVLVHVAALLGLPKQTTPLPGPGDDPGIPAPLNLRLAPQAPGLPPVDAAPSRRSLQQELPARRPAAPRPQPLPPVIALDKPAPGNQPVPATPPPSAPRPEGDMASYIEARQRARGANAPPTPAPAAEDDEARRQRIIAGNLGSPRDRVFGYDPSRGGGAFQIQRLGYDQAEFIFQGYNKDTGRNTKQLIEVSRGNNSDIRIAVVRRIITIIRDHEQDDFLWASERLGRSVTLSARTKDNAGLEEFMMREFFPGAPPVRR